MESTQLLKGVLPTLVLAVIAQGNVYGYSILRSLRRAGFADVGDASVYGTLQRLYGDGQVSTYLDRSERGPERKCYELTQRGAQRLQDDLMSWATFQSSVDLLLKV